jgi:hypothetical protein
MARWPSLSFVIASEAKQSRPRERLDCFVAALLAMTVRGRRLGKSHSFYAVMNCEKGVACGQSTKEFCEIADAVISPSYLGRGRRLFRPVVGQSDVDAAVKEAGEVAGKFECRISQLNVQSRSR